jgi:hypothetical protein
MSRVWESPSSQLLPQQEKMISEGVTGNLGTVFSGPNQAEAIDTCNLHVAQSIDTNLGERITLFQDFRQ